jgi:hypothetical protein
VVLKDVHLNILLLGKDIFTILLLHARAVLGNNITVLVVLGGGFVRGIRQR